MFSILRGDPALTSTRELAEEGRLDLQKVERAIEQQQVQYVDYTQGWAAYVLATAHMATAVLWQSGPLLWLHLPVSPTRVLTPYYESVACLVQMVREESEVFWS